MTQAKQAAPTVTFVDEYCALYEDVFPDVRSFEHFKQVQIGMLSEIKRKTLPAIGRAVGEGDPQALHHFVAYARFPGGRPQAEASDSAQAGFGRAAIYALY
jgi:SRSO17 transposase